ncbi:TDP43_N domain-containing protein [Meloidogyne graminicola]|uniref:TDP43_N domain-containing protein n=1 Tax=Meloidogyne graminicola TaxID=189291 RepID=A0A8S9ZLC1_9BILA|nr:TDP43_N domain-containing protein [Meloidogyne graminicola]
MENLDSQVGNKCLVQPSKNNLSFWMCSCGHIFCNNCIESDLNGCNILSDINLSSTKSLLQCFVCSKQVQLIQINRSMRKDLLEMFKPPTSFFGDSFKKAKSIFQFQSMHHQRLLKCLQERSQKCYLLLRKLQKELNEREERIKLLAMENDEFKAEINNTRKTITELQKTISEREKELYGLRQMRQLNNSQQRKINYKRIAIQNAMESRITNSGFSFLNAGVSAQMPQFNNNNTTLQTVCATNLINDFNLNMQFMREENTINDNLRTDSRPDLNLQNLMNTSTNSGGTAAAVVCGNAEKFHQNTATLLGFTRKGVDILLILINFIYYFYLIIHYTRVHLMSNESEDLSLSPCCAKLYNEKEMFRKALHRERENRQLIEQSYEELLCNYERWTGLKGSEHGSEQRTTPNTEWFKLEEAYEKAKPYLFTLPLIKEPEKHALCLAIGLYSNLFCGFNPPGFPRNIANVIWTTSNTYLRTRLCGTKVLFEGKSPYIVSKETPNSLLKAHSKLEAYLASKLVIETDIKEEIVEEIVKLMNIKHINLRIKLIKFGKLFEYYGKYNNEAWGLFFSFVRLSVKSVEHMKKIFIQDKSREEFLALAGFYDFELFEQPNTSKWKRLQKNLSPYKPLLGHFCTYAYLNESSAYQTIKRFVGLRAEFYGMSMLTMAASLAKLLYSYKPLLSLAETPNADNLLKLYASLMLYFFVNPENAISRFGDKYPELKKMNKDDAKAGRFARLFSSDYLPWLSCKKEPQLVVKVAVNIKMNKDDAKAGRFARYSLMIFNIHFSLMQKLYLMSTENIDPALPPSCSSSIPSSDNDKWFKLEEAYEKARPYLFTLPLIKDPEKHALCLAIGLYSNLFCGFNPPGFPRNIANVIWTTSNTYLRTQTREKVLFEGKSPYIVSTETPNSLLKAHSKLEAYLASKLVIETDIKEEIVEEIVKLMNIKHINLRIKLIKFGKLFEYYGKYNNEAWGLFFSFVRLSVKSVEHMKKIFIQDKSREEFLALAGFYDFELFEQPNTSKWKRLQKNLSPYKPLLGHFCTYAYLNESSAYQTIKRFVGLRAEFYGMSMLTMAASLAKLLYSYKPLLSLAETPNADNLLKLYASLMLYFFVNPENAISRFGDKYPELKKMNKDDAKAGRFARLFSSDYLPWLSCKKEPQLVVKVAELYLMSTENIDPALPPSCSSSIPSSDNDKWFKLEEAYEKARPYLFTLPLIKDPEKHALCLAIGLYSNLFCGFNPPGFPRNIANVIWTTSNTYLRTQTREKVLFEGKSPYIVSTETPNSLLKAHSKLEAYLASKLVIETDIKEEIVEEIVKLMNIKHINLRIKLIKFGKLFEYYGKYNNEAWGLFFSFVRLSVKSVEHMKKIFIQDKSREEFLALAGFYDFELFEQPNTSKWKRLQKNLSPYKPLLGHFCTYAYLNESSAYQTIKRFVGLRAEFYGMSMLTMAASLAKLLYSYKPLLSLAETPNADNLLKLYASLMLYFFVNPENAISRFGDKYPELKKMNKDDAKAGRFARLFSSDYLPWLSCKKEPQLVVKVAELYLMSTENIDPALPPSCSSSIPSSDNDKWFKLEEAYEKARPYLFTLPLIKDPEKHALCLAIGLYSNLFCGFNPPGFPRNIANVIWTTSNTYLRTQTREKVLFEGKSPYIVSTETPNSLLKAHSKLEAYLASKIIKEEELIEFGKVFCHFYDLTAWGLFFTFVRLAIKNIDHLKRIFNEETSRKNILMYTSIDNDSKLFGQPNTSKWKRLQKNLSPYKPLLGHFCTYAYLNEPNSYMTLKRFVGLRAEFYGMSILVLAKSIGEYFEAPNKELLSLLESINVDSKKILASIHLYSENTFESTKQLYGEDYPELKALTSDDVNAGRFARLFSPDYLPWLSSKKQSKLSSILLGVKTAVEIYDHTPISEIKSKDINYLKGMEAGILLAIEHTDKLVVEGFKPGWLLKEIVSEAYLNEEYRKVLEKSKQHLLGHLQQVRIKILLIK